MRCEIQALDHFGCLASTNKWSAWPLWGQYLGQSHYVVHFLIQKFFKEMFNLYIHFNLSSNFLGGLTGQQLLCYS